MRDKFIICVLCMCFVSLAWYAEDREEALLERIRVLAMENKGLEARVTKSALRAYCRVECGSCMPLSVVIAAMTRPNVWRGN
jgi:hypothetical protein